MRDESFEIDGVRQVFHVAGRGPYCVAHSGGPGLDWAYLRSPELEEHFTMVYPEPVGTGESGRLPGGGYRLATYARFLGAVVDHLDAGPVYVLGHSYGGFVAQTYALQHLDRVAGLILYSTSPYGGAEFWADGMAALEAYPQRHPDVPEAAAVPGLFRAALATVADGDDALSRAFAAAVPLYFADFWARRDEFAAFQAGLRMYAEPAGAADPVPFDVRDRLAELTAPTVVIAGRHDFLAGPSWARRLADGIPGARSVTLERSGHFGHLEQPGAFAEAAAQITRGRPVARVSRT
ncbi:hydrolase [Actinoplanes philippinensis]|uniref:alpha/beta fold hydrolase n=1 Tax=Actinoplanes philippinensis TaxID=35752 RepID=UPI001A403B65|nr:alpha/beta fold hydrolase [Actinoplanes philippinensis]GIE78592.1 hydrolase [Actinoplanes philippinensis]